MSDWSSDVCSSDLDKRGLFVGIDAYTEAGGCVLRDLFTADDGGWLQDAALLDTLVAAKLQAEAERIGGEGWKWVTAAVDLPYGHLGSLREIDSDPAALTDTESARAEALTAEGNAIEAEYEDVERSEEHTSELQSLMRISYAVFCLKKKKQPTKKKNKP